MFFFQKKKDEPAPKNDPKPATAQPRPVVNADDFFKDMGRKKETPKEVKPIDIPEVTGLREFAPAAPESTINVIDTAAVSTDILADKTLVEMGDGYGDISSVEAVDDIDTMIEREKSEKAARTAAIAAAEAAKPLSADDFFKDMGKRAKRRDDEPIDHVEIIGLRDAPPVPAVNTISSFADEIPTDGLRDKTNDIPQISGDINEIDISSLDMSSLRS